MMTTMTMMIDSGDRPEPVAAASTMFAIGETEPLLADGMHFVQ